ncbi:MAG: hypothetical protein ABI472_15830 [Ginsengibacter sp.]
MNENFEDPNKKDDDENLKNENGFLKMKLMLEHGAEFGNVPTEKELPVTVENEFLNYVMAYEKQAAERKMIKVFDRLERPTHFKPVNEITDEEIDSAWDDLDSYLNKYHIDLAVCSPNISNRDLYRFATEELFKYEMNDIFIPGGITCFTYYEFHPDHIYDNTRTALEDCIQCILKKTAFSWMPMLKKEDLRINDHYPLSEKEYINIVKRFKEAYEDIQPNNLSATGCQIVDANCQVKGIYDVTLVCLRKKLT